MTTVIDKVNLDKSNEVKTVKDFQEEQRILIKSLKNELEAVKTMAAG